MDFEGELWFGRPEKISSVEMGALSRAGKGMVRPAVHSAT